ncbi:hypothetical protein EK904_001049 [Melospiza melodia maxima]|nr:hypothetical protein EK904_001049 [Melospiza melodia maxima]
MQADICLEAKLVLAVWVTASSFELAPSPSGRREAVSRFPEDEQLARIQNVIQELPPSHYR